MKKDQIEMIKKCIESGEPTFTLRAQDKLSLYCIHNYIDNLERSNADSDFIMEIEEIRNKFQFWQDNHETKIPD